MSTNRVRLAGLVIVLTLLGSLVLPRAAVGAPSVVAGRAATAGSSSPVAAAGTLGAAADALAAAPNALGAAPGALGATAAGTGAAGTGLSGSGSGNGSGSGGGTGSASGGGGGTGNAAAEDGVAPPRVKAGSVLLADEETGQVLFERADRQPRAMASTTKVMTGLLALERLDQDRTVVIGLEPTTVGEESLDLRRGERLTVHQLLLGLLVKSANDAAVALADAVDGSEAAFVRRMNARAAQLGMRDTHYVTAYGLDRPGHRTSARDLARLWEVAMRRADFRALVSTRGAQLPGPPQVRKFTNTNQLLGRYPWAVGGKTGFTNDAGRCLVASASRGGRRLVAVALGSQDAFADVRALFEYGFTAFDWVRLAQRAQEVKLAEPLGGSAIYQVTADVDALVRLDLLDELALAPPSRPVPAPGSQGAAASVATTVTADGAVTIWIQAGGQPLAPLRLGSPGDTPAPAVPQMSSVVAGLVPAGSEPAAIDPFLRRAAS